MTSASVRVKLDERKLAEALANDPRVHATLLAKAEEVRAMAEANTAMAPPRRTKQQQRLAGYYWSQKPGAVAKTYRVDGMEGPLVVTTNKRNFKMAVALTVTDHPYSGLYFSAFAAAVQAAKGGGWKFQQNKGTGI